MCPIDLRPLSKVATLLVFLGHFLAGPVLAQEPAAQARPDAPTGPTLEAALLEPKAGASERNLLETRGQVIWSLAPGKAGANDPVIKGHVNFPDARLSLDITLRRNTDPGLSASHVAILVFSGADSAGERKVRDFGGIELRLSPATPGKFLTGIPIPLGNNAFGLALFKTEVDMLANVALLKSRKWFIFPVRYVQGGRATIIFGKGEAGEKVFADAFQAWEKLPTP